MTRLNGSDIDTARYANPAFDPRIAFSWTLRSEELARMRRQRLNQQPDPAESEHGEPDMAGIDGNDVTAAEAACYDAPAFDPRAAFSWTLRSAELARTRRERRNRLPDPMQLKLLALS